MEISIRELKKAKQGVIYRMIDEWNNDCPYDFKNIQFTRKLTDGVLDLVDGIDTWVYTFSLTDLRDGSVVDISLKQNTEYVDDEGQYCNCSFNTIKEAILDYEPDGLIRLKLNDNVFLNIFNSAYYGCYSNTFGNACRSNTFGDYCSYNTFGNGCYYLRISENAGAKEYLNIDNGLQGASATNQLELYDSAILNKSYQISFKKASSGRYLMLWATDTGAMTGKYKALNTDLTWTDL